MTRDTPLKAIRKKCLDCSGYSKKEVRLCPIVECPLYPYRMGTDPGRKGAGRRGGNPNLRKSRKCV